MMLRMRIVMRGGCAFEGWGKGGGEELVSVVGGFGVGWGSFGRGWGGCVVLRRVFLMEG